MGCGKERGCIALKDYVTEVLVKLSKEVFKFKEVFQVIAESLKYERFGALDILVYR